MEDGLQSLDPGLKKKIGISLEALLNLVYLAKLHGEDRVQSDCYLTLAEEKILELVQLAKTTDEAQCAATPNAIGKTLHAPARGH